MLETLFVLPPAFWVVIALLVVGAFWSAGQIKNSVGLPMLAVLTTAVVWYAGDVLYNDYRGDYAQKFTPAALANAWWEVAWFLAVFLVLTPIAHRSINRRHLGQGSQVLRMLQTGSDRPLFQLQLDKLFWGCAVVWLTLALLAVVRVGISEAPYYFFPFLGHKADPWGRGRIGGGIDALLSLANYFQLFLAATFGVVAALARNGWVRFLALAGCLLTWPYYIVDRTRNTMLAVLVPAVLAWVFLRLRGSMWPKAIILGGFLFLINAWFGFVMANRSNTDIASALQEEGLSLEQAKAVQHEGLNMYEELCWINTFIKNGTYEPVWGQEYFAEIANPIPRSLWPGKPMIGIDYAEARGMSWDKGDAGVAATLSTGMVGQGVINFGRILGPAFAALLMSLWASGLARLDLEGQKIGRIPLYALGLILTFNLGRDITLITLYTFVFGSAIIWWLQRSFNQPARRPKRKAQRARQAGGIENERQEAEPKPAGRGRHSGFGWWQKPKTTAEPLPVSKPTDGH